MTMNAISHGLTVLEEFQIDDDKWTAPTKQTA